MRSTNTVNYFPDIPLIRTKLLGDKSYDTPITIAKRRINPEILHDLSKVFQDVGPIAPRLLDTKHIPTPKVLSQNFDFPFHFGKIPTKERPRVPCPQGKLFTPGTHGIKGAKETTAPSPQVDQ